MSGAAIGRRAVLSGAAAFALASRRAGAQGPSIGEVLARIAAARASLRTLVGPFTQTRTIGLLATDVKSRGTLTLVRPDRLRWDLAPPDDATFWIGPEGLAYRNRSGSGRLPAASARLAAALEDLHALLGGDLSRLRDRYELRVVWFEAAAGVEIEAAPRPVATPARLRQIRFALAPDLVRPARALLVEGAKDRTEIVFGALERDVAVDPARVRPPA